MSDPHLPFNKLAKPDRDGFKHRDEIIRRIENLNIREAGDTVIIEMEVSE